MKYSILVLIVFVYNCFFNTSILLSQENCIGSLEFPICLYPDKKIEFIVYRNKKEVGWHTVSFKKENNNIIAETKAFMEAPYLLFFDYTVKYHSISTWHRGNLINLKAQLDDDGDEYTIEISKHSDERITVKGKEVEYEIKADKILPTEHWHPDEINVPTLINTLNGELVNIYSTKIDDTTWYIDGDIKYYINYDSKLRWTGLKFNADEDNIIEYICSNCDQ